MLRTKPQKKVFRILAMGGIGDMLLLTPVLRALRELNPTARINVFCHDRVRTAVFTLNPNIDSVKLICPIGRLLHGTTFKNIMDGKFPYLAKLGDGGFIDYGKVGGLMPHLFYSHNLSKIFAEVIGITLSQTQIEIYLSDEEEMRNKQSLSRFETPVAINVKGTSSPNKNWPIERWNDLVRSMADLSFFQLGLSEEPLVEGAVDMKGLPLRDSFARLKCAKAFIGVDSALAHAASGLKVPSVILFGPTNPSVVGHPQNTNLHHKLRCRPCFDTLLSAPCPYDQRCMQMITVEEVRQAVRRILNGQPAKTTIRSDDLLRFNGNRTPG